MPEQEGQRQEIELPVEWYNPESIVSQYATNMVVQHTEHEFIISFFDVKPPLIVGAPSKEVLETLKSIRATCVARIIVREVGCPYFLRPYKPTWKNCNLRSN